MTLPPYTRTREGETRQLGEWSELPLGGPLSYEMLSEKCSDTSCGCQEAKLTPEYAIVARGNSYEASYLTVCQPGHV